MVVKLRFKNGHRVESKKRKHGKVALASASVLTLGSVSCLSLGVWPFFADMGWAGPFVIADGLLSHGQVWMGAAIALQFSSWKLAHYGRVRETAAPEIERKKSKSKAAAGF